MVAKKNATKVTKKTEVATEGPSTALANASINPVPEINQPPKTWGGTDKLGRKGRRPRNGLTLAATGLAMELRKNPKGLSQELGPKTVDPQQLADSLDLAHDWKKAEDESAAFHTYVRAQRGLSWDAAITLMTGMKLAVRFALTRDASFADRFPGVAKAFAPTRRSKKKSDAVTTAAPAPAPVTRKPASPATAPEPAPTAEPAAAPADVAPTA